jgi:predicted transcriptional regulator
MKQPCEMTVLKVLPAIRSRLTKLLMEDGTLKQTEISELLGITQAAVSYYTTEKRGDETLIDRFPQIRRSIDRLGKDMVNGMSDSDRQKKICRICRNLQNEISNESPEE